MYENNKPPPGFKKIQTPYEQINISNCLKNVIIENNSTDIG